LKTCKFGAIPAVMGDKTIIPGHGSPCISLCKLTFLTAEPIRSKLYNDDMTIYPMKEKRISM
jgi:hypothetical protein